MWKILQKRTYDVLSHRYGLLLVFFGLILVTVSAFHFGEVIHFCSLNQPLTLA